MIEGRDIVCMSFVVWDEHWGTPQQLMSRFARANRVLYVEQPVSVLSFFTGIRSRGAVARQIERWRSGPRQVAPNVWAAAPPPVLPMRANKLANMVNAFFIRRWLKATARKLDMHDVIFWNVQPTMPNIARPSKPAFDALSLRGRLFGAALTGGTSPGACSPARPNARARPTSSSAPPAQL